MQQLLKKHLITMESEQVQLFAGIRILPLISPIPVQSSYITLSQALEQGILKITELSEAGSVPNLKVTNLSELPVLLLDGEELMGAKQNRILNTSVLVPGKSQLVVPVSCTEAGRWNYVSNEFSVSGNVLSGRMRASKMTRVSNNLSMNRGFDADQGEVWNEISKLQNLHGTASATGAMRDVYQDLGQSLEEICRHFSLMDGQCGIYVELGGEFAGIDVVSSPSAWKDYHAKIISSYALDMLRDPTLQSSVGEIKYRTIIGILERCEIRKHRAVGLGEDIRLSSEKLSGMILQVDEDIIHAAIYPRMHHSFGDNYHSPRHRSH